MESERVKMHKSLNAKFLKGNSLKEIERIISFSYGIMYGLFFIYPKLNTTWI